MDTTPYDVRMHSIFRNQPSYRYFNKSIMDPGDLAFRRMNEIDVFYLQPEQLADNRGFVKYSLCDPRTKQPVDDFLFDHTGNITTKIFHSPKFSCMNAAQHSIGVRVQKALQDEDEIDEADYLIWRKTERTRQKEAQQFHKFVYDFSQTNKEKVYEPAKHLMVMYKQWYEWKAKRLLNKYPDMSYNTHLGLPHLRMCKDPLKEQLTTIEEVTTIDVEIPNINTERDNDKGVTLDFKLLKRQLNRYTDELMNLEEIKEKFEEDAKEKFTKSMLMGEPNIHEYYIPLDSLLYLLTAGDYVDLPTEMLLNINEHDTGQKYIVMDSPLPSRQMGWHTVKHVAEKTTEAYVSLSRVYRDESLEISGCPKDTLTYEVKTVEDYMENYARLRTKDCNISHKFIKWELNSEDKETTKHIYTVFDNPLNGMTPYSLKLENKPNFGCELMTKYELLRDWFKLKLQGQTKGTCYRLDINNFQTLLEENQTLLKLEQQLSTTYHIVISQLLSNLDEFLRLLLTMPCGPYMLRYNSKYRDKMMLCKPSKEITSYTVYLHQLLKSEPSHLLFMSQQSYLPIVDNLCSLMHLQHKTLPCAFRPPKGIGMKPNEKQPQKKFLPINDQDYIKNKCKTKQELIAKRMQAYLNVQKKKNQRMRRRQTKKSREGDVQETK
ncbi:little elongation complex subunit 2 [Haematobia irritans]|uniref:little elongation complex subunit 2 n=1 Tax=Haematobia irritans TaxID=7368 RepID=UPI003F4F5675